jgi:surface polysaccharide O-acyltransferase-like enzyme
MAIFSVIIIHTNPFSKPLATGTPFDLGTLLTQLARFAVPCFFVLSGFFWAAKFASVKDITSPTVNMAKRLALIFLAWSLFYLLPTDIVGAFQLGLIGPLKVIYWNVSHVIHSPLSTLLQGTKGHLWFLPSLLFCLLLSWVMLQRDMQRSLLALALLLYGIGLLGKAYADTPIGFHVDFNFRDGPFFGLIFFVTGYVLQRKGPQVAWLYWGAALTVLGFVLHFSELLLLHRYWGISMRQDFVIGTYFAGVGMALIALSNAVSLDLRVVSRIGPLVLGVYALHFVFVDLLGPLNDMYAENIVWAAAYPLAVFVLSSASAYAMSRFPATRQFVA